MVYLVLIYFVVNCYYVVFTYQTHWYDCQKLVGNLIGPEIENADPIDLDVFYIVVKRFTQCKYVVLEIT